MLRGYAVNQRILAVEERIAQIHTFTQNCNKIHFLERFFLINLHNPIFFMTFAPDMGA